MSTSTTVNNLKINKLTKAQYDAIQSPSETELYLVEESVDTTPTSGSNNLVSSGGVYTALQGKASVVSNATNGHLAGLDGNGNLTDSGFKIVVTDETTYEGMTKDSYTIYLITES